MSWTCAIHRGKAIPVADALSRAQLPTTADADDRMNSDIEVMVHAITSSLPMSGTRRDELQRATAQDEELQALRKVIFSRWPDNIKAVPSIVRQFWTIREELHEADQMLFRGTKVIIPTIFRSEMLRRIHEGHQGAEKSKERARAVMYWPNMNKEIEDYVSKCTTCLRFRWSNTKEPLEQHDLPERPWQMIAADIMTFKRRDYLMVVDYYSKYVKVPLLLDKTAKSVITTLKSIFSRHSIPDRLICDNVPFASRQVRLFSKEWGFKITTSSPKYPQSNGLEERNVQTIKQLMRKCHYEGSDPYLALLNYRSTPIPELKASPARLLMSRNLKTRLPTASALLQPDVITNISENLRARQHRQKYYYDRQAQPMRELEAEEVVCIQRDKQWEPAVVTQKHTAPRSYIVTQNGRSLRRNRRHIHPTLGAPPNQIRNQLWTIIYRE